jgi:hypothetical protein
LKPEILALIMKLLPASIAFFKSVFKVTNPNEPVPTDEQIIAAYQQALQSSLDKDQAWLDAHPE